MSNSSKPHGLYAARLLCPWKLNLCYQKKKKKVPFRSSSKERLFIVLSAAVDSPPRPSCSKSASFLVSNRTDHSSPQNRKITIKLQKANVCPTLPSYCSCHLKLLFFISLKSGVLSSCFLFLGSSVHNLRPFSPPIIYPSTSFLLWHPEWEEHAGGVWG